MLLSSQGGWEIKAGLCDRYLLTYSTSYETKGTCVKVYTQQLWSSLQITIALPALRCVQYLAEQIVLPFGSPTLQAHWDLTKD